MITIRTPEQIEAMKVSGALSKAALLRAGSMIRPWCFSSSRLTVLLKLLLGFTVELTFKGYGGFPGSVCSSNAGKVNFAVFHPANVILQDGDILTIDTGATVNGWAGDNAWTFYCRNS